MEDNCIVGVEERAVAYHTERGLQHLENKCVYLSNVHRAKDIVFVTGLQVGQKPIRDVRWTLQGDPQSDKPFTVLLKRRSSSYRLRFDLAKMKITLR